jgi:hypothetical protein
MWPFGKSLEAGSIETGCVSGTFECRGKHHLWGQWEPYMVEGMAYSLVFRSGVPFTEKHQKRQCHICGFTEDKEI